jgi:hypothetical protein
VFLILLGIAGVGLALWAAETWGHLVPQRLVDVVIVSWYVAAWGLWLWRRKVKPKKWWDVSPSLLFLGFNFALHSVQRLTEGSAIFN